MASAKLPLTAGRIVFGVSKFKNRFEQLEEGIHGSICVKILLCSFDQHYRYSDKVKIEGHPQTVNFPARCQYNWTWKIISYIGDGENYFTLGRDHQFKVGKRILHIGLIPKVIFLKLFLDIVPGSFADSTRALRFASKAGKPPTLSGCLL